VDLSAPRFWQSPTQRTPNSPVKTHLDYGYAGCSLSVRFDLNRSYFTIGTTEITGKSGCHGVIDMVHKKSLRSRRAAMGKSMKDPQPPKEISERPQSTQRDQADCTNPAN
jgi:hypothetical protein